MAKTVWSISFDIVTKQSRKEMYKDAKKAIDAANKRIKRLEASGMFSPALESVKKHGGKFSTKGLNRNQLLREYAKAVEFMNMKTSTITGAKAYDRQIAMKLSNKAKSLTIDQKKTLFKAVRRTMEANPTLSDLYGSDRLIRFVADEVADNNEDDLAQFNKLIKIYSKPESKSFIFYNVPYEETLEEYMENFKK